MNNIHFLTDLIIAVSINLALGMSVGTVCAIYIKRKMFYWAFPLFLLSSIFLSFLVYWIIWVPTSIHVARSTIDIESYKGKPLKIAVISDLHVGMYSNTRTLHSAITALAAEHDIDAMLIAGDLVFESDSRLEDLNILTKITDSVPTYAVLGNHDYIPDWKNQFESKEVHGLVEYLQNLNITVLQDTWIELATDKTKEVAVFGTKDLYFREPDFSDVKSIPSDSLLIMLSHNPDTVVRITQASQMRKPDLMISGHTHGGELRLPGDIPVLPIPIYEVPSSYDKGLFYYEDIPLFISSGLGSVASRIRTWNNPEVVILEIL